MKKLSFLLPFFFLFALAGQVNGAETKGQFCPQGAQGGICPKEGKGMCHHQNMHHSLFKGSILYALKHLDLSAGDWNDVHLAFKAFNESMKKINHGIPIKSLDNGKFNKERFLKESPMHEKLAAKAELLETIYLILDENQKKKFQMLIGAHQDKMKLERAQRGCDHAMCQSQKCDGTMCDGKKCDGKMCAGKKCDGKMCEIKIEQNKAPKKSN